MNVNGIVRLALASLALLSCNAYSATAANDQQTPPSVPTVATPPGPPATAIVPAPSTLSGSAQPSAVQQGKPPAPHANQTPPQSPPRPV